MKRFLGFLLVYFFLTGCSPTSVRALFATETPTPTITPSPTATFTPSPTLTPTNTPTPTSVPTLTPTPAPVWTMQGPGSITCPILLYHRIQVPSVYNEYFVAPDDFRAQMQALKDWGYTPIPISLLVKAINFGAKLPERPVVISFDDGDITVYTTAFPIMREFGFVGLNYIVADRLKSDGFMTAEQIKETLAAGWEVGSHSMTHADLTQSTTNVSWEIAQSQYELEQALGVKVETFAYPFGGGEDNLGIIIQVRQYYRAAVGQGVYVKQTPNNLYTLWRRPVDYGWDVPTFGSFLPWNTPLQP